MGNVLHSFLGNDDSMKIAFDLRRIENPGVGRYMQCLVGAIVREAPQHEYFFIMSPGTRHMLDCTNQGTVLPLSARYYSIAEQVELPALLRKHRVDLFHALHFVVPVIKVCPIVVSLLDTIHIVYPQDLPSWTGRQYARVMLNLAGRLADGIVTISEYSKSDIVRYLHIHPAKVTVTYAAVAEQFHAARSTSEVERVQRGLQLPSGFLLYTGIYKKRKNHDGLLKAFASLLASGVDTQLVIAGPINAGVDRLKESAAALGIGARVHFTGFVPEEDLPLLYAAASAYVCPSLYEGFGQTLVEAMACGTPVVSHNETSLPEVCGDAALYADARNPEEFAAQLRRVLEDTELRSTLIERGYANVARFSPQMVARRTLQAYDKALSGRVKRGNGR
jgi:glycosyltransferase involved in cell wall biosynthesis